MMVENARTLLKAPRLLGVLCLMWLCWFDVVHVLNLYSVIGKKPSRAVANMCGQSISVVHMNSYELITLGVDVLPTLTTFFIFWCHDSILLMMNLLLL